MKYSRKFEPYKDLTIADIWISISKWYNNL